VDTTIRILEATAQSMLEVSLRNTTNTRQEAKRIIPIADETAARLGPAHEGGS